ncbi:MAG: hypothetical protein IJW55_03330 [Clostridia bacterium]|nr:hypothetical protein [Clostridia bacterium]
MNNQFDYTPQNDQQPPIDFGMTPPQQPTGHAKGYAIASLVLGIAAVVFTCCCFCLYYIAIVLSIISIVMAFLAKRDNGGKMPGKATAGLILAIIGIILFICWIAFEAVLSSGVMDEALDEFFYEMTGMTMEEYLAYIESSEGYLYE